MKYKYIICIWLLFGMGAATSQNLPFEKITIEQGLSQGMIFSILQTRDGFLWVATKDGLNRYDGYNFKVFSNNPFDSLSIAGNTVSALFEDSRGWLWVGIEGIGAEIYDPRTGHFHLVSFRFESTKRSPNLHVDHIGEAADGSILVLLASGGLLRIEIPEGWKKGIPPQADLSRQTKISPIKVENLIERQEPLTKFLTGIDGKIALFSSRRQFQVEVETNTAKLIRHTNLPDSIRSIGRAIGQQGWWIMDAECRLFWANDQGVFPAQTQIMDLPFANISTDSWGKCWLLMGKKLWQLEKNYRTIDLSKPDWEFDKDITQVQSDRDGNIWVGTWGYGLRKINLKNQLFSTGATGNSIWRLWRSPAGKYYCRKGLLKIYPFDPLTGLLGEQLAFPELGDKGKRDLCFEPSGAFWVLASTPVNIDPHGFLCRFDASGQLTQTYPFDFFGYDYSKLITDRDGYLWATGAFSQLVRFDPRTAQFRYFDYSQVFGENPRASQSFDFVQDGNGVFWLATQKGLIKCTPKTPDDLDFKLFQTDPKNPRGLNHNSIACLLPDPARPAERLWIGTKGGGINCLDLKTNEFRYLTQADGMPDKVVYAILPGNENPAQSPVSLWASTNRGLVKLTQRADAPFAFDFITYSAAQGLQDNEFNTQAFFKASNGELLFGGVNGMNHFFPEKLQADTAVPPVFIVGLEINHERADVRDAKIQLVNPPEYLQKLELSHDQNNISIEFAALDFTDPSKNRYRYRLIGLDVDWVETGNHRFAYFSHLAPGTYELRVQGNNGESAWREASPLILVVNPPWYRSKLAYLCYALLLAWLGWHVYQFQIRRIKEREQLAFEHRETERIKVLEQLKTNFFSNITHEFRTPLTLMIEPLRRILPKIKDPEVLENVQLAEKNSRQLLGLINQLLDMAKLESGQMGLDLRRSNIGETVRNTFERFLPLAEKRGIKLVMAALPNDLPLFDFDAGKVELVLNNLISNALKFTLEGGKVEVAVGRVSKSSDVENIEISVCDTGIGIAPENLDKIFDRFYQVDGSYTRSGEGTGIGLALSKELAALMGGQILVESPDPKSGGKGTVFKLALPVSGAINMVNTATLALDVIPLNPVQPSQSLSETRAGAKAIHADMPVVLVVEDNNELRNFIKNAMVEGWQVVEASDGEDGLKKALDIVPDIVVSDVMMPRKDGLTLLDELKNHELTAHIPVVLLTSKSAIESRLKGLRHGADDYLTKPFSVEELLTRMENLVETRRRLRAIFGKQASSFATLSSGIAQGVTPTFLSEPDREFLQKFILILEKNLADETLGVEDFAQKMFISRVQLHRKLKALTDQPATNFIRDYRLECALTMLKNREGRVGEIALRVGFGNEKYFSTAFKEKFGVSPSQV